MRAVERCLSCLNRNRLLLAAFVTTLIGIFWVSPTNTFLLAILVAIFGGICWLVWRAHTRRIVTILLIVWIAVVMSSTPPVQSGVEWLQPRIEELQGYLE